MELAKIFLTMLVWPAGQAADSPMWASEPFFTVTDCEANALKLKFEIQDAHAQNSQIEHYCISIEDRLTR